MTHRSSEGMTRKPRVGMTDKSSAGMTAWVKVRERQCVLSLPCHDTAICCGNDRLSQGRGRHFDYLKIYGSTKIEFNIFTQ